jgi:hypothetical protein
VGAEARGQLDAPGRLIVEKGVEAVPLIAGGVVVVLRLKVVCHTIVVVERIALLVVGVVCGKLVGLPYSHHSLYRNNGDGTFTDVSNEAGISKVAPGYGLTVVAADFDEDGWQDILCCVRYQREPALPQPA